MSDIIPWDRQPPPGTPINRSNPSTKDLLFAYTAESGIDTANNRHPATLSGRTTQVGKLGKYSQFTGTGKATFAGGDGSSVTGPITIIVLMLAGSTSANLIGKGTSDSLNCPFRFSFVAAALNGGYFVRAGAGPGTWQPSSQLISTGETGVVAVVATTGDAGVAPTFYRDGRAIGATLYAGGSSTVTNTSEPITVGYWDSATTGNIYAAFVFGRALPEAEIKSLSANIWALYAPIRRDLGAPSDGIPVTAALTSVTATGSVGTVVPAVAPALGNVAITSAVGTTAPDVVLGLTGLTATGSVGTLAPTVVRALTNVAATGAVGTVVRANVALTSVATTSALGTMVPAVAPASVNVASSGAVGSVAAGVSIALTSVASTGAVGSVTASSSASAPVSNVEGTSATGSVNPAITIALTSVAATSAVGSVSASQDIILSISGVEATSAVGLTSPDIVAPIGGVQTTGQVGNFLGGPPGAGADLAEMRLRSFTDQMRH